VAAPDTGPTSVPVQPETTADLQISVTEQRTSLDAAERAVRRAEAVLRAARSNERGAASRSAVAESALERLAANAYIEVGSLDGALLGLALPGQTEDTRSRAVLKALARDRAAAAARLDSAEKRSKTKRLRAEAALTRAKAERRVGAERLDELETALNERAVRDYKGAAATSAAADRARRSAAPKPTRSASPTRNATPVGGGLMSVSGITVDASIANNLGAMLAAAQAAGIDLSGNGYRSQEAQRRLRQQNCPDPVSSPASACSPATAQPGQSMHEQGLAVDFTSGGSIISSRGSAAFQWLAANAGRFGFANLPSEPWHWSVDGR